LGFQVPDFRSIGDCLSKAAPKLEVLRLNCGRAEILPPAIFAYETPCLRELELRGCAIPKDSHLFRNLSYLSIDELPPDSTFTVLQWLGILGSLPLLEVLSLTRCFSRSREPPYKLPLVQLPELFSLALEGCIDDCSDTLNHLVFPPTPCFEIKCYTEVESYTVFLSPLLDSLGNILKKLPPAQKKLHALGISWTFDGIHFCASPEEKGEVAPGSEDSEFYLAFRNVLEPPTFALTLAVLDALPTSDIAMLDLGTPVCCQCPPPSIGSSPPTIGWVSCAVSLRCIPCRAFNSTGPPPA
jgi:hypothetical protein